MAEIDYCIGVLKVNIPRATNNALKIKPLSMEVSPHMQKILDAMQEANETFDKTATECLMIPSKYFK